MQTTLCYLEKEDQYLMLHRTKKVNDMNHDKWIGVGGKLEAGETPEECLAREVKEETGFTLLRYHYRGLVTFVQEGQEAEYMYLYTADAYTGNMISCNEGELVWIPKKEIENLNLWEGDKVFFRLLETCTGFFSLKLCYQGEKLVEQSVVEYH